MSDAGAVDTGQISNAERAQPCLDCGLPVTGAFCLHCGQRQTLRPLSLGALVWDLLIEILDTDARVWRTLRTLVLKPGRLTLDWMAGRRTRHVPPFRLYLVLNVLTFLIFSLSTDASLFEADEPYERGEAELLGRLEALEGEDGPGIERRRESLERALATLRSAQSRSEARAGAGEMPATPRDEKDDRALPDEDGGPITSAIDEDTLETSAFFARFGFDQEAVLTELREIEADPGAFGARVYDRLPTLMFALLPLLALVMSLMYLFSGRPYVVHLVGLAHLHAFVFLLLLLMEGFDGFAQLLELLSIPLAPSLFYFLAEGGGGMAFLAYLVAWLKHLYGHGTGGAIAMSVVIVVLHVIGLALGVSLVAVVTFLLDMDS